MKLEDAFLCLVVPDLRAMDSPVDRLRDLIGVGVDIVQVGTDGGAEAPLDALEAVRSVCSEEDAIFVLSGDPEVALQLGADGVHVDGVRTSPSYARSVLGFDALVAMSSRTRDEASLALELEPDYLLHYAGADCAAVFSGFRGMTGAALYAAGIGDIGEGRRIVEAGVCRLAVDYRVLGAGNPAEQAAAFSRLLGRSV